METNEIMKLTRKGITDLLALQHASPEEDYSGEDRRQWPRWPSPGTVELWPIDENGAEQWFGTLRNVNETGLGCTTDEPFEPGTPLQVAFHLPEASFYGKGTVCHCTLTPQEQYIVGVQFDFEE